MLMSIFLFLLVVFCMILIFSTKNHYLTALLLLEVMVLLTLVFSFFIMYTCVHSVYISIILLTTAVCEAALGVSLLMSYIKIIGSDAIKAYF
uniref:NADH dehydrogenase subunit 4L n=1 Tax=Megalophaedusa rex TaxID=1885770 RepID=A0A224ABG4_9EUPU|nr:NADH dehydrogenase subunit 4L [Megalophaedusa rex]